VVFLGRGSVLRLGVWGFCCGKGFWCVVWVGVEGGLGVVLWYCCLES